MATDLTAAETKPLAPCRWWHRWAVLRIVGGGLGWLEFQRCAKCGQEREVVNVG